MQILHLLWEWKQNTEVSIYYIRYKHLGGLPFHV